MPDRKPPHLIAHHLWCIAHASARRHDVPDAFLRIFAHRLEALLRPARADVGAQELEAIRVREYLRLRKEMGE